ncbi:MAG: hypothetical protein HHJ11_13135 [Phycicoccus sp.]|nr:hypothetical protein [Cellulomonas sp.]NMM24414.1 hypothetical protein [Phycicoccus sp.]
MVMLRDVFNIPEKVDASDFVLQLQKGVAAAERTLSDYVVTDALAKAIDDALSLVQRTIEGGASKGAFVHGSFGSGKSHFMAVLHLLLTGNTQARALPGLQEVVAQRGAVLDTNLLAIDYHLLGKKSFEEALFDGYLQTVARLKPDRELPVLHQSDGLLADAARLRAAMGDEAFFASLNTAGGSSSGWGARAATWTAETYGAAATAPIGDSHRDRLVNALVTTHFSSFRRSGEWLEISAGLRAMTEHAQGLGYDGVVLFLDELVLWLAQHLSDSHFIQDEASKVAKLVETEMSTLPVPLISFVARQRDLKEFLAGNTVGAEQLAIGQSFSWWEDRFERIELAAADLPQIVHRRLLTPVGDDAAAAVANAVARVRTDSAAWGYLLTDENRSSGTDFELTYPFSPALVDAMIALSALMQRERTALRLMGELLSAGRNELTITDVIPVGDLFDVVVLGGSTPLAADMKQHFAHAREFYETKLRPHLLTKHGMTEASASRLARDHAFRTEDRLAKTLLVAALAPGAPSLRDLTAAKLAALNYGTIQSFIPGQQAQRVMTIVKEWSAEFGELHIGEGDNPLISFTLTGVDYDTLLEYAQGEDTDPNRRTLLRTMLSDELGVTALSGLVAEWSTSLVWRGSKRHADVLFGNVRDAAELSDDALRAAAGHWKVVIDFPFDIGDHTPQEDLNRLFRLKDDGIESTTLVWLPHFLTPARMADVGKLVQLEYLLTGERFEQSAIRLNPADRPLARTALETNRRNLRSRVLEVLRQAYGAATPSPENVDAQIHASEVFTALSPGLMIAPPVTQTLRGALESALRQALDQQYPDHPLFDGADTEIKRADLTAVLDSARSAIDAGGRLDGVERSRANLLRRVANPLGCGSARETVYALAGDSFTWLSHFTRWNADAASLTGEVKIGDLRHRLEPFGMVNEVEDLLILVWAALEDREWLRGGTHISLPGIGQVTGDMVLRPARLPSAADWAVANRHAAQLFGAAKPPRLSAAGVARLAADVRAGVQRYREPAAGLSDALTSHADLLGLDARAVTGRLATAKRASALLDILSRERDDTTLLTVLASTDLPEEPQPLARSMSSAAELGAHLRSVDWGMLESGRRIDPAVAAPIFAALATAAGQEELHVKLAPAITAATHAIREHLLAQQPVTRPPVIVQPPLIAPPVIAPPVIDLPLHVDEIELNIDNGETRLRELWSSMHGALRENPGKRLKVRWWLE